MGLKPGSPPAFAFAVACVVAATMLHAAIGLVRPDSVIFDPYYAATLVTALAAGTMAGGFAMVLGGAIAYWLFAPADWTFTALTLDLVNWALYGTSSIVILWAAASYRALVQRLREEERQRQLLNTELAHRLRNALASMQTIVNQSLNGEKELRDKITDHSRAVLGSVSLLGDSGWRSAGLKDILTNELKPYDLSRIACHGDDIKCPAEAATVLALVIHELVTNAAKYGALSKPDGGIDVSWQTIDGRLILRWVERADLPSTKPTRQGFGTRLMHSAVRAFHGTVETTFAPGGLSCTISLLLPET